MSYIFLGKTADHLLPSAPPALPSTSVDTARSNINPESSQASFISECKYTDHCYGKKKPPDSPTNSKIRKKVKRYRKCSQAVHATKIGINSCQPTASKTFLLSDSAEYTSRKFCVRKRQMPAAPTNNPKEKN